MRTCVFTVAHAGIVPYLDECALSLEQQTDRDFDWCVFNDNCSDADLKKSLQTFSGKTLIVQGEGTPVQIRQQGILKVRDLGYEVLVFADADDRCAQNRVQTSKKILTKEEIIFNELLLFGNGVQSRKVLGDRFQEGGRLFLKDIQTSNCLGFSNTAIRSSLITRGINGIPSDLPVFDWAFFSALLFRGGSAVYSGETFSEYRQYDSNLASLTELNDKQIAQGIYVKRKHYEYLKTLDPDFSKLEAQFQELEKHFQEDSDFRTCYCERVVSECAAMPLWWEPIRIFEWSTRK